MAVFLIVCLYLYYIAIIYNIGTYLPYISEYLRQTFIMYNTTTVGIDYSDASVMNL